MTGKEQGQICDLIPQFKPTTCMSDWEIAPHNAFKDIYPEVHITGCWFHFTQRIWHATQKVRLVRSFNTNEELSTFVRFLMAIPFLPKTLIQPTYRLLNPPMELASREKTF